MTIINTVSTSIRMAGTLVLMTACSLLMLMVATTTLFQLRSFYAERIATPFGRLVLRLWGINVVTHQEVELPCQQYIYISNHTSTVDVFVLIALRLPNTRFFLSGFLRKWIPLGIIGYIMGIFWTVDQKFPERRARIFQRAEHILRRTGESVYLSPEGERITTGEIGHFNKGAFHLATVLHVPIVPLYIQIPPQKNLGKDFRAEPCTINVFVRPPIDTREWHIDDLLKNRSAVRDFYINWHHEFREH